MNGFYLMPEWILEWGRYVGYPMVVLISIIGIRLLLYYRNFFLHWPRYRQLKWVTTADLKALPGIPFVKVQVTTRGALGSTEVIRRGIQCVVGLAKEDVDFYGDKLSVEVVTESSEQKYDLEQEFDRAPIVVDVIVIPKDYETSRETKVKARGLHYMVELRRRGFNHKPGRTFIVHYDEESVMEPEELRKLIHYLATTGKKLSEGPIFYPLEYNDTSVICQAMEANRPLGCFECREVMEKGLPLHLHGSNLVIEEEFENELGWDIGNLDGQPFIAEDYVFGVLAYLKGGSEAFGWHGATMLEQPPFSFKSAFKQRYRWIVGVLQGMEMLRRMPQFYKLTRTERFHLIWGTRFRVATFALGLPTGTLALLYLLYQAVLVLSGRAFLPLPVLVMAWLVLVGFLWLNSIIIGIWFNVYFGYFVRGLHPWYRCWIMGARAFTLAPISGALESSAAVWAVLKWMIGHREVSWTPTPKTKKADEAMKR